MSATRPVRGARGRRRRSRHRRARPRGRAYLQIVAVVGIAVVGIGYSFVPPDLRTTVQARLTPSGSAQPGGTEPGPPVERASARAAARPAPHPGQVTPSKPRRDTGQPGRRTRPSQTTTPGQIEQPSGPGRIEQIPPASPLAPVAPSAGATGPGRFVVAAGPALSPDAPKLVRYTVEVEQGIALVPTAVASVVDATLADKRSWGAAGYTFRRTAAGGDLRILLATPGTVDKLCAPLDTLGELSCRNENLVVLNARRWLLGAPAYGADIANYRRYVVNHEVGHFLGHGHLQCPGPGRYAPVMLQQTLGLGGCKPNPWPALSLPR